MYSLNECQNTVTQAARGAGLDWGLAEESGRAAYWLAAHQLPLVFFSVLTARADFSVADEDAIMRGILTPQNPAGVLCPLLAGAYLSDCAASPAPPRQFFRIAQPLLLLPFAARVAAPDCCLRLTWQGVKLCTDGKNFWRFKEDNLTAAVGDVLMTVVAAPASPPAAVNTDGGGKITLQEWEQLKNLAAKTFVPESEESRKFGAGGDDDLKNN